MNKKRRFTGVQFVEVVRHGKQTIAFGVYKDAKIGKIPFAGVASKSPEDTDSPNRGRNLAIGRAFENLGKQIEKQEWKKIKPKHQSAEDKKRISARLTAQKEWEDVDKQTNALKKK